jgi:hypothetical protein
MFHLKRIVFLYMLFDSNGNGGNLMRKQILTIVILMLLITSSTAAVVAWNDTQKVTKNIQPSERDYLEYGDAPEGPSHIAYPSTGVPGAFPTCMGCGPSAWIQHNNFGAWFGPSFDFESEGNAGWCPGGFPPYDQDEGFQDGDAGLMMPEPYTIDNTLTVIPFPGWTGTPLGTVGAVASWGVDIDIWVHNTMPGHEPYLPAFVNLLIDWNQNGIWGDPGEHVLVNFLIPPLYIGSLSALIPPPFIIGPNSGYVWSRFSITESAVPLEWTGEGEFEDGETEDYLLRVDPFQEEGWYYKSPYDNYAPQGIPDFDQQQDQWKSIVDGSNGIADTAAVGDDVQVVPLGSAVNPGEVIIAPGANSALDTAPAGDDVAKWSFCGPTAVANCFWWFDSKFDDPTGYPGDGVDVFALVEDYGVGDDHSKTNVPYLISDLAVQMNTTTRGTTNITEMKNAIQNWLINKALSPVFLVNKYFAPDFTFIKDQIEQCQDVILLLGFYNDSEKLVDQMQMLFSTNDNLQPTPWTDYQSFVPSVNKLDAINITLVSNGEPCDVQINVYDTLGGPPIGTSVMNPGMLGVPTWVQFHFPTTIPLVIGNTYYFDVHEVPSPDNFHYEWFYFASNDNYPPGQGWMDGVPFDYDWAFRTEYYPDLGRLKGHYVTCAGVNSLYQKIAISDPELDIQNPAATDHNDAANVSHDIYTVGIGCPIPTLPYQWWLQNYPSVYSYAIVEQAVIICPRPYNYPPFFGTPVPGNGSTNNPRNFIWSIPINDPEGDIFSWSIECSNGQSNSGTAAVNGTKTLSLSNLAYSTEYTVWVNATDPPAGSGIFTREWFTFTTKSSLPPVFGSPSPVNGSTHQPLGFTWSIPISDPEGDMFSWTIQCSNGQSNSGTGASNGTKNLILSGMTYGTTYTIWVNATDPGGSGLYTREWFIFTTLDNQPPVFGTPSPGNGSTNQPLNLNWGIPIIDPEGNTFSWTIHCSNGQSNSGTAATNGTKSLSLSGLLGSTTYTVWVNATDPGGSGQYTRRWYTFTTQQQQNNPPNKPNKPTGTSSGKLNTPYVYSSSTTDPDGDQVYYMWDWGDGQLSAWLGPYPSGSTINTTHTWTVKSSSVKIKAKDSSGSESPWSDPLPITMPFSYSKVPLIQFIKIFLEQFPRAFPMLRFLLGW